MLRAEISALEEDWGWIKEEDALRRTESKGVTGVEYDDGVTGVGGDDKGVAGVCDDDEGVTGVDSNLVRVDETPKGLDNRMTGGDYDGVPGVV